ncbi:fimbrial protein [Erwinia sp. B116]|uniref:fimbrial protein n=1 Tax=Erwinia sp. B116 TaxID=1561024 RepID=UPI0011AF655A|nr:fimbrial protein [Erwinia sp. B116]
MFLNLKKISTRNSGTSALSGWKSAGIGVVVLGVLSYSAQSAACSTPPVNLTVTSSVTSLQINPDVAVGQVAGQYSLSWPAFSNICEPARGMSVYEEYITYQPYGIGATLFPTNIGGLSYRMKVNQGKFSATPNYKSSTYNYAGGVGTAPAGTATVELVKTGTIANGGQLYPVNYTMFLYSANNYGYVVGGWRIISPTSINITLPLKACTVTQSAITVNLDTAETAKLATAGSTTKDKSFSIPINCPSTRNLSLQFSGTMADNSKGVLKNLKSGSSNASSLGIQLLRNGTPVQTGTKYNIGNVTGNYSVPMTARYYALANNVPTGDIQSISYATITYN